MNPITSDSCPLALLCSGDAADCSPKGPNPFPEPHTSFLEVAEGQSHPFSPPLKEINWELNNNIRKRLPYKRRNNPAGTSWPWPFPPCVWEGVQDISHPTGHSCGLDNTRNCKLQMTGSLPPPSFHPNPSRAFPQKNLPALSPGGLPQTHTAPKGDAQGALPAPHPCPPTVPQPGMLHPHLQEQQRAGRGPR